VAASARDRVVARMEKLTERLRSRRPAISTDSEPRGEPAEAIESIEYRRPAADEVPFRRPSADELRLLCALVARAPELELPAGWEERIQVQPMADGGMGSLLLRVDGIDGVAVDGPRRMGSQVAELRFTDEDGVAVLVALNTDQYAALFELDVWKVEGSPTIRIPPSADFSDVEYSGDSPESPLSPN
jgi:uncharacterized protein DUF6984